MLLVGSLWGLTRDAARIARVPHLPEAVSRGGRPLPIFFASRAVSPSSEAEANRRCPHAWPGLGAVHRYPGCRGRSKLARMARCLHAGRQQLCPCATRACIAYLKYWMETVLLAPRQHVPRCYFEVSVRSA